MHIEIEQKNRFSKLYFPCDLTLNCDVFDNRRTANLFKTLSDGKFVHACNWY